MSEPTSTKTAAQPRSADEIRKEISKVSYGNNKGYPNRGSKRMLKLEELRHELSNATKTPAQPETPSPSLQELIFAIEEERRAKMQWARNAYAARAHADKLAKALRETADVRIWGKSSPIFARALAALSDYEAIKRGAQ